MVSANNEGPCEQSSSTSPPSNNKGAVFELNGKLLRNTGLHLDGDSEHDEQYWHVNGGIWRPAWLQPVVLLAFFTLFFFSAISLPAMFFISSKNRGLVTTQQNLHYLWRFGPTAVITLVSILWSRVETQALRYMPWIAHRYEHSPKRSYDDYELDYTAIISPKVLIQSFKRKHYLVFLIATISALLRIQMVLAPGLYSFEMVNVTQTVDIEILDTFNTTVPWSLSAHLSPYYMAQATQNFDIDYPFGITEQPSYQTFTNKRGSRGTTDSPIETNVAGYLTETQCLKLKNHSYSDIEPFNSNFSIFSVRDLMFNFNGYEQPLPIRRDLLASSLGRMRQESTWKKNKTITHWASFSDIASHIQCKGLPEKGPRSLYYAARFGRPSKNSSPPILLDVAAVLCFSGSWVKRVKVIDDGKSPTAVVLSDEAGHLADTNLWDFIGNSAPWTSWNLSGVNLVLGPLATAYFFFGNLPGLHLDPEDVGIYIDPVHASLYTTELLYQSAMNMSRILGPWIGHYRLRKKTNQPLYTTGTRPVTIGKLMVNKLTCLLMTVLFVLIMAMLTLVLFSSRNTTKIWYRDLATVMGNMIFLRTWGRYPEQRSKHSSTRLKEIKSEWSTCNFTPLVLRVWARVTAVVLVLAIMTSLCYTLILSTASRGIATIHSETGYLHMLWTSFPAFTMLSVALYINSCDSAYRGLAIFSALSAKCLKATGLDISFSDMLGLKVLYHSLRAQIGLITLTQFLAICCGFLTTLISVIFTVETVPQPSELLLQPMTWFGNPEIQSFDFNDEGRAYRRSVLGSLVIRRGERNLTYPKNTYDDLVFPILGAIDRSQLTQNPSVKVNLTTAKLNSTCWKVHSTVFNISISPDKEFLDITETFTCPNGLQAELIQNLGVQIKPYYSDQKYFASRLKSPENPGHANESCNLGLRKTAVAFAPTRFQTYAFGKISPARTNFKHFSMRRCKYTWVQVPTEVSLIFQDGEYSIDQEVPPRPNMLAAEPWDTAFAIPNVDIQFQSRLRDRMAIPIPLRPNTTNLDPWFETLIQPFGRFPADAFGDPSFEEEILKDVHHLYGFLVAQLANVENRLKITESSRDGPAPSLPNLKATITNLSHRRLMQDPTVTYIIVAILTLTAISQILMLISSVFKPLRKSRLFNMNVKGLAPDGFNSIAAMTALLKDSNAMDHLPEGAEHMSKKELHEKLSGLRFRMGWFWRESTQTRHYTIGVLDDENFEYLGNKDEIAREDALLRHPPE
ncbi:uncharacterized protein BDZ83DRAFT_579879 [Colletotrichum acutatum]|uniref:Uncharacterized protein n=1 Tax=Glomerella acutata TaxID=27357 RepID=A0AAD8XGF5_GLOAC|nr:uncharacterized protein BDZ83DRAFT_579879 [Colletotrichum acutatum]KAK1723868.1 hypothetical protein BDZ83DRAFT_579879 [Colletotrichum acutatum]